MQSFEHRDLTLDIEHEFGPRSTSVCKTRDFSLQVSEENTTLMQADVDAAVAAAKNAFERNSLWRKMDASKRGKIMTKAAELIEENISYIAVSSKILFLYIYIQSRPIHHLKGTTNMHTPQYKKYSTS